MSLNRRNTTFVVCALALSTGLAIAAAKAQSGAPQSAAAPKLAEDQFKNIKVLKGVPADQIISVHAIHHRLARRRVRVLPRPRR